MEELSSTVSCGLWEELANSTVRNIASVLMTMAPGPLSPIRFDLLEVKVIFVNFSSLCIWDCTIVSACCRSLKFIFSAQSCLLVMLFVDP